MATIMPGYGAWTVELYKALGEEPKLCRSITIQINVDSAVIATIEKYVDSKSDILEVIQKVAWVKDNSLDQKEEASE
jgi:hypothetical protein